MRNFSMRFAQLQYQSTRKMLEIFDMYQASLPYRQARPSCRPKDGGC